MAITIQKNKPVARAKRDPSQPCPDVYIVKLGDTLYSLSLDCGFYYKEVAQANDIKEPYAIKVGEKIKFDQVKSNNPVVTTNEMKKNEDVVTTPLKNNEEDMRAILNTSLEAIVLIDKNGKIIESNKVFLFS